MSPVTLLRLVLAAALGLRAAHADACKDTDNYVCAENCEVSDEDTCTACPSGKWTNGGDPYEGLGACTGSACCQGITCGGSSVFGTPCPATFPHMREYANTKNYYCYDNNGAVCSYKAGLVAPPAGGRWGSNRDTCPGKSCPAGYTDTVKDVADTVNNVNNNNVLSINACAAMCSSAPSCNMYEYNDGDNRCKISSGSLSGSDQNANWISCVKGWQKVRSNCNCGARIAEWSNGYDTALKCQSQCEGNTDCRSFGLWTNSDKGYCALFDQACTPTGVCAGGATSGTYTNDIFNKPGSCTCKAGYSCNGGSTCKDVTPGSGGTYPACTETYGGICKHGDPNAGGDWYSSKGSLVDPVSRLWDDHCGSCDAGYRLELQNNGPPICFPCGFIDGCVSTTCTTFNDEQCTACSAGYVLNDENTCTPVVNCVETTADASTCTSVGQQLYTKTTPASGGGTACTGISTLCVAGDIPATGSSSSSSSSSSAAVPSTIGHAQHHQPLLGKCEQLCDPAEFKACVEASAFATTNAAALNTEAAADDAGVTCCAQLGEKMARDCKASPKACAGHVYNDIDSKYKCGECLCT